MPTINKKQIAKKETPYVHYNNQSMQYYNTRQWKNLRSYYIKRNPVCEKCLEQDIITPATEVHHIKPFMSGTTEEERYTLLTDEDNLIAVCHNCHMRLHRELNSQK